VGIPFISEFVENTIGKVVDKALSFIPDPQLRAQAEREIRDGLRTVVLAQIEVNKIEAQHQSIFVAGWRPWIGWCCGVSFAYSFIAQPFIITGILLYDPEFPVSKLPGMDWGRIGSILMGMLGISG
jgi:hypothetical protein